jgi:hypothetical protein
VTAELRFRREFVPFFEFAATDLLVEYHIDLVIKRRAETGPQIVWHGS